MTPGLAIDAATERPAIQTVLVVDDIPALVYILSSALQRQGYDVLTACDGADAMRVAEAHPTPIQLLLTDIQMPGMNGVALWQKLHAKQPHVRVIFMSGSLDIPAIDGQPVIRKPFTLPTLIDLVRNCLDNESVPTSR
jgi:CheY-like chemotaxis protein